MRPDRILTVPPPRLDADVLVVGTGPGGATVGMLAAERGRDVVFLEEGPYLPLDSCLPFSRTELETKYRHGGLGVTIGSTVVYGEGRCVGGGSEINSALYHRTPDEELDRWRTAFGVIAAGPDDLRPHFEASERDVGLAQPGPELPGASQKLRAGARALGWDSFEVPRLADSSAGGRRSMTRTMLPRALAAGARLLPDTKAERLRHEAGRWRVLAITRVRGAPPRVIEIRANNVWVCAGAIQTPALLRRSGIRKHVGVSLRVQTMVRAVARFADRPNGAPTNVAAHQVKEFSPRYSFGCSISTPPHLAMAMLAHPTMLGDVRTGWEHMAIFYAMIRGGEGSVHPLPGLSSPLVRYRLGAGDLVDLAAGMRDLCRVLLAAGAEVVYPGVGGASPVRSEADLGGLPGRMPVAGTTMVSLHLLGTCPMGDDGRGATDSFGRVRGCEGLYVGDASVIPAAPGVNPQGSIMAFARRNAEHALTQR